MKKVSQKNTLSSLVSRKVHKIKTHWDGTERNHTHTHTYSQTIHKRVTLVEEKLHFPHLSQLVLSCLSFSTHMGKEPNVVEEKQSIMTFQQRHEVLFLNNVGANFLRHGEIDNAINSLSQALNAVKQCGHVLTSTTTTTTTTTTHQGLQNQHEEEPPPSKADEMEEEEDEDEELDLEQYFTSILEWTSTTTSSCSNYDGSPSATFMNGRVSSSATDVKMEDLEVDDVDDSRMHHYCQDFSSLSDCSRCTTGGSSPPLYVYQSPLELPIDDDLSIVYKVQCITILFNLALSFQLKAKREEEEMKYHHHRHHQQQQQSQHDNIPPQYYGDGASLTNSMMLRNHWYHNSIALYELCYEVLNCGPSAALSSLSPSTDDSTTSTATPTTAEAEATATNDTSIIDGSINPGLHFLMILTNNLGQCHDSLCNYDKARTCFEQLLSIQMYLVDSYGGCFENDGTAGNVAAPPQQRPLDGSTVAATSSTVLKHSGSSHSLSSTAGMTPWEGFVSNTSRLVILLKRCASAA